MDPHVVASHKEFVAVGTGDAGTARDLFPIRREFSAHVLHQDNLLLVNLLLLLRVMLRMLLLVVMLLLLWMATGRGFVAERRERDLSGLLLQLLLFWLLQVMLLLLTNFRMFFLFFTIARNILENNIYESYAYLF